MHASGSAPDGHRWHDPGGGERHGRVRLHAGPRPTGARSPTRPVGDGPQAFAVRTEAGGRPLRPHFHTVDQFQVVVEGGGRLGHHELRRGSVHYADALRTYGPLAAGPAGLTYLTLRCDADTGASYMPGSRDELARLRAASPDARRRNLTVDPAPAVAGRWLDRHADDDGLRIARLDLAPGAGGDGPTVGGRGAWLVVLEGSVLDAAERPTGSLRWCGPGAAAPVVAGGRGAALLLVQFPASPPAPASPA